MMRFPTSASGHLELTLRNAILPSGAQCDIGVAGGYIVAMRRGLEPDAQDIDVKGCLILGPVDNQDSHRL